MPGGGRVSRPRTWPTAAVTASSTPSSSPETTRQSGAGCRPSATPAPTTSASRWSPVTPPPCGPPGASWPPPWSESGGRQLDQLGDRPPVADGDRHRPEAALHFDGQVGPAHAVGEVEVDLAPHHRQ